MAGDRRGTVVRGLQYLVALGALAWLVRSFDLRRAGDLLLSLDAPLLLALAGLTAVEFGTRFGMWYALLRGRWDTSLRAIAGADLTIKFVNHVVPSKAAGHSVAPLMLRRFLGLSWPEATTVAGLNTALYGLCYGTVAAVGLLLVAPSLSGGLLVVLALSTAVYLAAGGVIMLAGRNLEATAGPLDRLGGLLSGLPLVGERLAGLLAKAPEFTGESGQLFRDLSGRPSVLLPYAMGWAGTLFLIPGARTVLLLGAVDAPLAPVWLVPFVLVVAYSVTVLPVTPGGVGVSELSATLVLVALGVPEEAAFVVVLLDRSLGVYLPALLGGIPAARLDLAGLGQDTG